MMTKCVQTKVAWWRAPSAICTARRPDDACTGYPGAMQVWDRENQLWRWLYVGSGYSLSSKYIEPGQRRVWVKRWKRVKGGWQAQLDSSKTVYPEAL